MIAAGAPIDAFGVGTQLGTRPDAPTLGCVYKLVEDVTGPKMKLSAGKVTLPGRKQVHRADGHDVLSLRDEDVPGARPLLEAAMVDGRRVPAATVRRRGPGARRCCGRSAAVPAAGAPGAGRGTRSAVRRGCSGSSTS